MTKLCKASKLVAKGIHAFGCDRTLDISLFSKKGDGVQDYCKSCHKLYKMKLNYKPNPAQTAREMCNQLIKEK